jgi:hypothetical protein
MMIPKVSFAFSLLLALALLAASNCHVQAQQRHQQRPRRGGRRLQKKNDATATSVQSAAPSQAPKVSAAELLAASVSNSINGIGASFVEECVAVLTAKRGFVETNKSVKVRYEYEVLVLFQIQQEDPAVDLARIASAATTVDEAVQNYLIRDLMLPASACNGSRRLTGTSNMESNYHRHLLGVSVTAITQGVADTVIPTATCILEAMMLRPVSALERCFRMEGSFRVYLRDDAAINMDEVEAESIRQEALTSVERGFRNGLIYLGGGSTIAAHYLGPNDGTADSLIAADQESQQQDAETTATSQGNPVDDTSETTVQGNPVDDTSETQVDNAPAETMPTAASTTQGNQLEDIVAGITSTTATTTKGNQLDNTNGSITTADTGSQDSQSQEGGLEQQTSITDSSPDKNSSGGLSSVAVTIFLTLGGILGLVGAAYTGKKYYRRSRLFGRGVDKNFDDDSLGGHEQYPAVKFHPNDTTMNTSSAYSANEPGTEDFLRDLEDLTFDTPSKGSISGSSLTLSVDADMLGLSLMDMAIMGHNATKNID